MSLAAKTARMFRSGTSVPVDMDERDSGFHITIDLLDSRSQAYRVQQQMVWDSSGLLEAVDISIRHTS